MGFERRCQRKAGCPLLGFNRDAGQSLPFPASPSTLFTPKIRLDSKQSWLIFKSRNNKRRWRVGGEEERGKEDNSCDSGVWCFSFKLVCKFRFLDLSHIKLFVLETGEKETFLVSVVSHQVSGSQLKPEECLEHRGLIFPKENKKIRSFNSGSLFLCNVFQCKIVGYFSRILQ